jgi:hypothetical protein
MSRAEYANRHNGYGPPSGPPHGGYGGYDQRYPPPPPNQGYGNGHYNNNYPPPQNGYGPPGGGYSGYQPPPGPPPSHQHHPQQGGYQQGPPPPKQQSGGGSMPLKMQVWQRLDDFAHDYYVVGPNIDTPMFVCKNPAATGRMILTTGDFGKQGAEVARAERAGTFLGSDFYVTLAGSRDKIKIEGVTKGLTKQVFPFTMNINGRTRKFEWKQNKGGITERLTSGGYFELHDKESGEMVVKFSNDSGFGGTLDKMAVGTYELVGEGPRLGPEFAMVALTSFLRVKQKAEVRKALKSM